VDYLTHELDKDIAYLTKLCSRSSQTILTPGMSWIPVVKHRRSNA